MQFWNSLGDGQVYNFDPSNDVLQFDDFSISASQVSLVESGGNLIVTVGNKSVTLLSMQLSALTSTNFTFQSFSVLSVGDNFSTSFNDDLSQSLTGSSFSDQLIGLGGDDTLDGGFGADLMAGGAGNDTYYVDDVGDTIVENSSGGTDTVLSAITFTLGNEVENLTLTNFSPLDGTGNALANVITGNSAANILTGGAGDDTYIVDSTDLVVEAAEEGVDTVQSEGSWTLGSNLENLTLTGFSQIDGTGNTLANAITGNSAANLLDGGAGADTLAGGQGNDTYGVDDAGDVVSEAGGDGTDLVRSSISYTLGTDLENLTLTGTGSIDGTGNSANNTLAGNSGNNVLDGGAGDDSLVGGAGNDTYVVDGFGDTVVENPDAGTDLVRSSISYTLGSDLENLTLTGTDQINGTGNALNNAITGNSGNNVLEGGAGNDTLDGVSGSDTASYANTTAGGVTVNLSLSGAQNTGGAGTDTLLNMDNLVGSNFDDVLSGNAADNVLNGGSGFDVVSYAAAASGITISLAGGAQNTGGAGSDQLLQIEGLIGSGFNDALTGDNFANTLIAGAGADSLVGGESADTLDGGTGADTLDGGAGTDSMAGGADDDTYVVDDIGDVVTEAGGGGVDLVQSFVTYTLGTGLENLTLTGVGNSDGTGNSDSNILTGNSGNNSMVGGAGADTLDGAAGADTLTGGADNDTYVVDNAGDVVSEAGGGGTDLVRSSVSYTLVTDIENLTLTGALDISGTGNTLGNSVIGNTGANLLSGGGGNDFLDGLQGNDTLDGGLGDDSLEGGTGTNTVSYASAPAGVTMSLALQGVAQNTGGAGNDTLAGFGNLAGSGFNDTLAGNASDNVLDGGAGTDTITYAAAAAGVSVSLALGGAQNTVGDGTDTLAGFENLTGSASNDTLTGDGGANTLDGGAGTDTLTGGAGNDTYVVDNAGDAAVEVGGGGTDLALASVSYTLGADVENLILTGSSDINGTGNTQNNVITGNTGDNLLDGAAGADTLTGDAGNDTLNGGTGADTMSAGAGNDTYVVNDVGDSVLEAPAFSIAQVSVTSAGAQSNGNHNRPVVTADGRYVIFDSDSYTLVSGDNPGLVFRDVFVKDVQTGAVTQASTPVSGGNGNQGSRDADVTDDGQYLVFESFASNLVSGDTNSLQDIFVKNLWTGELTRETNFGGATLTDNQSLNATLSDDGRFLAFHSVAENLVAGDTDTNNIWDIFVKDLQTQTLTRVSTASDGAQADYYSLNASLSGDGHYVVFESRASNLVASDSNGQQSDIFVKDLLTGAVTLVSASTGGVQADGGSSNAAVTPDGRYVVFQSIATNLVANDNDGAIDIFVKDLVTGNLALASANAAGQGANGDCTNGTISADGRYVVFQSSFANNLVPNDPFTNTMDVFVKDMLTGVINRVSTIADGSLTTNAASINPAISGDGRTVVFESGASNIGTGDATWPDIFLTPNTVFDFGGDDEVRTGLSYALGNHVEKLTLTGTGDINGTGNALANLITGNPGINLLDGGVGADTLAGGGGADTLSGGTGGDSMAGGDGNDLYFVDDAADVVSENAAEGADTVHSGVTITLGANIEDLVLTAPGIAGAGNAQPNRITADSGSQTLSGGMGADTLSGGTHDDVYVVDDPGDVVVEAELGGVDRVESYISYVLGAEFENLTLIGTANINATGNSTSFQNTLIGNSGNNVLDGGGGPGQDILAGGAGDDTYMLVGYNSVTELSNQGHDTVVFDPAGWTQYQLPDNVEDLTVIGTDTAVGAVGNALDNVIIGNNESGGLDGGAGNDTLIGGDGSDSYTVDAPGDVIVENSGQGSDGVNSTVSWTLGDNLESLNLMGTANIDGTGNALNNIIAGNSGNNVLDGGTGADWLIGGAGDDTYIVNSSDDPVSENVGGGYDTVLSSITYTMGDTLEKLVLTGAAAINGTGGDGWDYIVGNGAANTIVGGAGRDTMEGGAGDDTYYADNSLDVIVESADAGTDTVFAQDSSHTLGANLENLTLVSPSNTFTTGTGNGLANIINGSIGLNSLDGGAGNDTLTGGAGADTLTGGTGDDTFVINFGDDLDMVAELSGGGTDTARAWTDHTLAANVENLVLLGLAAYGTGNGDDNMLTGNDAGNVLDGAAGADTLDGGAGNDNLSGGEGFDLLRFAGITVPGVWVDLSQNAVFADGHGGADTVTGVEAVEGTAGDDTLVGGIEGNLLVGNGGLDILEGGAGSDTLIGGSGMDSLAGGMGNDTHVVSSTGTSVASGIVFVPDTVTEYLNNGIDTVYSSSSYALPSDVENLVLTGAPFWRAYTGTGNALDNAITGSAGRDVLDGGAGADTLDGGGGNDVLVYDAADTSINGGAGEDRLLLSGDTDLNLAGIAGILIQNVEVIDLVAGAGGNSIALAYADVLAISSSTDVLRVDGNADDTFDITDFGGWTQEADQAVGSNLYRTFTQSAATLLVDTDIVNVFPL